MKCPNCHGSGRIADAIGLPFAKPEPRRKSRERKRTQHREEIARIRTAVILRAAGRCEGCLLSTREGHLDHWLGGAGRRRQKQSEATCWWLCPSCDHQRTNNEPNAAHWNDLFRAHCARHGFWFIPHLERSA